jgi:hypothetical protein
LREEKRSFSDFLQFIEDGIGVQSFREHHLVSSVKVSVKRCFADDEGSLE